MALGDGFPPFYPERPSSVMYEPNQVILGYVAAAIFVGLLLILPGVRGRDRLFFLLRWSASLFVGVSIIACAQGISWHEAVVDTILPYHAQTKEMARFRVGLKIGLTSYNVTLKGDLDEVGPNMLIFSEQFQFLQSDEALERGLKTGLPFPILNVLEHFSVNRVSSLWQWGRRYWIAGHYASYMLWSAFALWVITNILLHTVLRYGGLVTIFTGLLMIGANASFTSLKAHGCHLEVHLGYYEVAVLRPTYGWCFWLCLSVGIFCVLLGSAIFIADNACSKSLKRIFSLTTEEEVAFNDVTVDNYYESSRRSSEKPIYDGETNYGYLVSGENTPSSTLKPASTSAKKKENIGGTSADMETVSPSISYQCHKKTSSVGLISDQTSL